MPTEESDTCDYYVQQEKSEVIGDYNCSGFMFIRASTITKWFMKVPMDACMSTLRSF